MLPKTQRVSRKTFDVIFSRGHLIRSSVFTLRYLFDKKNTNPAISFSVPKKIAKNAVVRNTQRRMGYLLMRGKMNLLPKNFSGIVVFNKHLKRPTTQNKKNEFKIFLEQELSNVIDKIPK